MYTLAVMLVRNRELKEMNRREKISNLSQWETVGHKVHPLIIGVGLNQPGDGEGEGGEDQVDGVTYWSGQAK